MSVWQLPESTHLRGVVEFSATSNILLDCRVRYTSFWISKQFCKMAYLWKFSTVIFLNITVSITIDNIFEKAARFSGRESLFVLHKFLLSWLALNQLLSRLSHWKCSTQASVGYKKALCDLFNFFTSCKFNGIRITHTLAFTRSVYDPIAKRWVFILYCISRSPIYILLYIVVYGLQFRESRVRNSIEFHLLHEKSLIISTSGW